MLYSLNGNYPTTIPNRIRLSNGFTRTDSNTFTPEEIADAGWVAVSNPPTVYYPDKLEWTGTEWNVRSPNATEIADRWEIIKAECKTKLLETDYKVIKAYELNETLSQDWIVYRQNIRDIYNNVNNIDPWNFIWPTPPAA